VDGVITNEVARNAAAIRREALQMVSRIGGSHLGGALSMADILAVLYWEILNVRPSEPTWPDRDRFLLSKGHSCSALYATLALKGFFPLNELATYGQNASRLLAHVSHKVPGVEFSTGSLGHALPFGAGKALAAKRRGDAWRVFVLLSDGELDEGSNWEAALFSPQHRLDNLTAIIDYNKIQSLGSVADVLDLHPLAEKFRAFRWSVREIDGHDPAAIRDALNATPWEPGKPSCLIAHTVKGKGVDFMEHQLHWHYASPKPDQLSSALAQLDTAP
jgi:transketolase